MIERRPAQSVQLKVRMRESLRCQIEAAAKDGEVSLNAEIVRRLEMSFDREAIVDDLAARLRR